MLEPLVIGYLTSSYARAGDTFIRREVAQLRRLGHTVHTFSIRAADPAELVGEEIRREHAQTVYLLEAGPVKLTLAGLRLAISAPGSSSRPSGSCSILSRRGLKSGGLDASPTCSKQPIWPSFLM